MDVISVANTKTQAKAKAKTKAKAKPTSQTSRKKHSAPARSDGNNGKIAKKTPRNKSTIHEGRDEASAPPRATTHTIHHGLRTLAPPHGKASLWRQLAVQMGIVDPYDPSPNTAVAVMNTLGFGLMFRSPQGRVNHELARMQRAAIDAERSSPQSSSSHHAHRDDNNNNKDDDDDSDNDSAAAAVMGHITAAAAITPVTPDDDEDDRADDGALLLYSSTH